MTRLERTHKTPLRLQSCIRATIFGKAGWVEGGSILYSERPPDRWAVKGENPRNSSPNWCELWNPPRLNFGCHRGNWKLDSAPNCCRWRNATEPTHSLTVGINQWIYSKVLSQRTSPGQMFRFPEPLLVQKPEDEVMTARLEPRRQETEVSYVMSVSVRYMVH